MARLLGPDNNSRMAILPSGAPASGRSGTVYANAAGTVLADILAYQPGNPTVPGAAIAGSVVTTDAYGMLPLFWWPDSIDVVWISVNGGPVVAINADYDARLDAAESSLATKASTAALSTHLADAANPHAVTKAQVGLGNADNTADTAKPVSVAQQAGLDGLELFTLRTLGYMDNAVETNARSIDAGYAPGTGRVELSYVYAYRTLTVTQLVTICRGTVATGLTGVRRGIYTVAGNGDLTLVARTALQTSGVYAVTFTEYAAPLDITGGFPASYQLVKGTSYVFAHFMTFTTTSPQLRAYAINLPGATATSRPPRVAGSMSGQTDLPASIPSASVGGAGNAVSMFATP